MQRVRRGIDCIFNISDLLRVNRSSYKLIAFMKELQIPKFLTIYYGRNSPRCLRPFMLPKRRNSAFLRAFKNALSGNMLLINSAILERLRASEILT